MVPFSGHQRAWDGAWRFAYAPYKRRYCSSDCPASDPGPYTRARPTGGVQPSRFLAVHW